MALSAGLRGKNGPTQVEPPMNVSRKDAQKRPVKEGGGAADTGVGVKKLKVTSSGSNVRGTAPKVVPLQRPGCSRKLRRPCPNRSLARRRHNSERERLKPPRS
jgi:hypothetical protein